MGQPGKAEAGLCAGSHKRKQQPGKCWARLAQSQTLWETTGALRQKRAGCQPGFPQEPSVILWPAHEAQGMSLTMGLEGRCHHPICRWGNRGSERLLSTAHRGMGGAPGFKNPFSGPWRTTADTPGVADCFLPAVPGSPDSEYRRPGPDRASNTIPGYLGCELRHAPHCWGAQASPAQDRQQQLTLPGDRGGLYESPGALTSASNRGSWSTGFPSPRQREMPSSPRLPSNISLRSVEAETTGQSLSAAGLSAESGSRWKSDHQAEELREMHFQQVPQGPLARGQHHIGSSSP